MEKPEAPKSRLFALEPLVRKLPEVEIPKRRVLFKERFLWVIFALVAFLALTQVEVYGIKEERAPFFGQLRWVLASHAGSLVELGIGPIVTAGIIMQLLVGSKIIGLNLRESKDRALFTGVQKFLSIVIGVVQAAMFSFSGWYGALTFHEHLLVIAQLSVGVIVVLYLDELVSKYGFGSGISLFIAAGVSTEIIVRLFIPGAGILWSILAGVETFFLLSMVLATLAVFFIVVFAENMRVEIPIAYGRFGGMRGRYPIRFLYASVIPVILAMIVFTNVRMVAGIAPGPILGTVENGVATGGLIYYLEPPMGISAVAADPFRAVVYFAVLVGMCVGFAVLWIYMSGMGPRDIAEQLDRSGMLIPGFRRDVRVMEWVLGRYILPAAVLGGAFIGVISALADFTGAIGGGTGILLTVGILYGLYEEIARERVAEMYPALRRFFGE